MTMHTSLHTGSAANPVLSAQDGRLAQAGLIAAAGPGPLDVRLGVILGPGAFTVSGTASTSPWQYSVPAAAFVTSKGTLDGSRLGANDAPYLVSTIVPPASNSRYDVIYVMQRDADATISPDASTAPLIGVVNGTAAASPTIPAIPAGAYQLAHALVASTATGGTSGAGVTITQDWQYTTTRGGLIPVQNGTERGTAGGTYGATAMNPLRVWRGNGTALRQMEVTTDGTTWSYVPQTLGIQTWATTVSTGSVGAGFANGTYTIIGNLCVWSLDLSFGTSTVVGSGLYVWNLPAPAAPGNLTVGQGYYYNGAFQTFLCQYQGSSTMVMRAGGGTSNTWASSYAPFAAGNVGNFSGSYLIS